MQVTSDITGLPQEIPERTIGASYGNAFMAGLGSGIIPGVEALETDWVKIVGTVEPNPSTQPTYDALYEVYLELYKTTKESVHRLGKIVET